MKINGFAILSLLSLVSGSVARRGTRFAADDDNDPIDQHSRVTAFINTEEGIKVECWEIGDFLPDNQVTRKDGSKGTVRKQRMLGDISITLFSFAPSVTLFQFGTSEVHSNAVDFRSKPNLFTVKDGLIFIEATTTNDANNFAARDDDDDDDSSSYVFAGINGDDWFYFEDQYNPGSDMSSKENCAKSTANPVFNVRTISGSETTLINFEYESTPHHKVLHEGRCNFAGLKPVAQPSQRDRFRSQEM